MQTNHDLKKVIPEIESISRILMHFLYFQNLKVISCSSSRIFRILKSISRVYKNSKKHSRNRGHGQKSILVLFYF